MGLPGLIGSQVPDGPGAVWRDIQAIRAKAQEVQAQIGSAQALITLANQQITLQNQQIALASNQVVPAVASNSAAAFSWSGTAYHDLVATSLTVPTGYTRALVTATGAASLNSGSTTSDSATVRISINGVVSQPITGLWPTSTALGMFPMTLAVTLTGLTAGAAIPVVFQAAMGNGPLNGGFAVISASCVFLK